MERTEYQIEWKEWNQIHVEWKEWSRMDRQKEGRSEGKKGKEEWLCSKFLVFKFH